MKINLFKLHQYIFSDGACVEKDSSIFTKWLKKDEERKEIKEFFFGKEEKVESKISITKENTALIIEKNRSEFRAALRTLKANGLENILFGNATDPLKDENYTFPSDTDIAAKFRKMDKDKYFFVADKKAGAEAAFIQFFKITKIIGDFIENNRPKGTTDETTYEYAYKLTIMFYQDATNGLKRFEEYLGKFIQSEHPLRDALNFRLPYLDKYDHLDLPGWQKLFFNYGPPALKFFEDASRVQRSNDYKAPAILPQVKIDIVKFYEYIFSGAEDQLLDKRKEIKEFFFDKEEKAEAKKSRGSIRKRVALIDHEQNRFEFRVALRELKATTLETILFGNTTDRLIDPHSKDAAELWGGKLEDAKYYIPTDADIAAQFRKIDSEHHFFEEDKKAGAEAAFMQFFKTAKLIGDFVEGRHLSDYDGKKAYEYAYKLTAIFYQDSVNVLKPFNDYLEKFIQSEHPLRDALDFSLPTDFQYGELDRAGWQKLIFNFGPPALQLFNNAISIQNEIKDGTAPETLAQAQKAEVNKQFALKYLYPELADLCVQYGVDEKAFNACLNVQFPGFNKTTEKLSKEQRSQYAKQVEIKTADKLPDIMLEGNSLGFPGYWLVKLPKNDPRAYLIGKITDGQQSAGKDGIEAITSENDGFYVLLKQKKLDSTSVESKEIFTPFLQGTTGKKINYTLFDIVGQGYAWRSAANNLVFNYWKNKTPEHDDAVIVPLLKTFSKIVTREPGAPMRVMSHMRGKTPKNLAKNQCWSLRETTLAGESPYRGLFDNDQATTSMIYCNEERRKPFVTELEAILDTFFADKNKDTLSHDKKVTLYKWICNGYSESYFSAMKELLQTCNIDLANALQAMVQFNKRYTNSNPLKTLKIIITEMSDFKKANLDPTPDMLKLFISNIDYARDGTESYALNLSKAFKRLEEAKLDKDPEVRDWILGGKHKVCEATADHIINCLQALQKVDLDTNPCVRTILFEKWGFFHSHRRSNIDRLISDYTIVRQEGLDKDETICGMLSHMYEYKYDETLAPRLVATAKKLKAKGMFEESDVRQKALYATRDNREDDVITAFELLREAKREKETDVRQAVFKQYSNVAGFCSQLMSELKQLEEHKLDRIPCLRNEVLFGYRSELKESIKIIFSVVNKLKEAKLDSDQAILEAIAEHGFNPGSITATELLIAGLSHLKEEKLDSDSWLRRRILEWYCHDEKDIENIKVLVATVKKLKPLGLDQDEGILEVLAYSREADKSLDAILKAYKKIDDARVPIDKEVRKAIARANLKAEKYADNIIANFDKLKEQKLDGDSAVCKTVFLACQTSRNTAKKVIKAASLCQQAEIPLPQDTRSTLLKTPSISMIQARLFTHFGKSAPESVLAKSLAQEPEEMGLIAEYQAALSDLDKLIETETARYNQSKERHDFDVSASEAKHEATSLKQTLELGGNIHALRSKTRHEFRNHDVNEIYLRFKKIIAAPENRLDLKEDRALHRAC